MFPISSKRPLSFLKISSYWRREITPAVSFDEVLNLLSRAWWQGDLAAGGARRTDLLRFLYRSHSGRIAFAIPGSPEPQQFWEFPDGSVEVVLWRVPLPNSKLNSWDDSNCSDSFRAVAEFWDCDSFRDLEPVIAGLETTEKEFVKWVASQGWPPPIFWAHGEEAGLPRSTKRMSKVSAKKRAVEFLQSEKEAGRRPTQQGFEIKMHEQGIIGCRTLIRSVFKEVAESRQLLVRRGRPVKQT